MIYKWLEVIMTLRALYQAKWEWPFYSCSLYDRDKQVVNTEMTPLAGWKRHMHVNTCTQMQTGAKHTYLNTFNIKWRNKFTQTCENKTNGCNCNANMQTSILQMYTCSHTTTHCARAHTHTHSVVYIHNQGMDQSIWLCSDLQEQQAL